MTEQAVYINGVFFALLKKQTGAGKDPLAEFEQNREKRVEKNINPSSLCLGPYLSQDKQNLVYIYKANKNMSAVAK